MCIAGMQAGHDSGTMVAYGTGPVPDATMVVNADASSSRSGTLGPAGTFVTAGGEAGLQGGSDYQAAVQAASQGADGSVLLPCSDHAYTLPVKCQQHKGSWVSTIYTFAL